MELNDKLKKLRVEAGLSQEALAIWLKFPHKFCPVIINGKMKGDFLCQKSNNRVCRPIFYYLVNK